MDEKMKCEVVQDLLPLYVDGACTDGSRRLVEEHVKSCPGCEKLLDEMRTPLPEFPTPEPTETERMLRHALKKIRLNSKRVVALCLAILLLIPVGILIGREGSGEGLCLSNYEEYRRAENTVENWIGDGAATAADSISPLWLYESLRQIRSDRNIFAAYNKHTAYAGDWSRGTYDCVELMGEAFYIPGESFFDFDYGTVEGQTRKELYAAGDELGVIYSLMQSGDILVPETLFRAVSAAYGAERWTMWRPMELEGERYYYPGRDYSFSASYYDAGDFEPELYALVPGVEKLPEEYWILREITALPEKAQQYFERIYERVYGYYQAYNAYYDTLGYEAFKEAWREELKTLLVRLEELGYPVTDASFQSIRLRRDSEQKKYYCATWILQMGDKWLHIEFDVRDYGTEETEVAGSVCFPMNLYCYNAPEEVQEILDRINDLCSMSYGSAQTTLHPNFW